MLSMQESRDIRQREQLLLLASTLKFGNLYRVPESIWKTAVRRGYDGASTRNMHPGVSLSGPRATLDAVPMLHGTSGDRGPVVIKGLFPEDPLHRTSFGHLLAPVPLHAWRGKDGVCPLYGTRTLTAGEKNDVLSLARKRGWL